MTNRARNSGAFREGTRRAYHVGMTLGRWTALGLAATLVSACFTPACFSQEPQTPAGGDDVGHSDDALRFQIGNVDRTLPDVDAIGYEVALRVSDAAGAESFEADVRGTYVTTRELTELALDLDGNTVDAATVEGHAVTPRREGARLVLPLPTAVPSGTTLSTRIRLHGSVRQADGANPNDFEAYGGLMVRQRNAEGRRIFTSLNWPSKARRWLPLRDHPSDGAMVVFAITFPRSYTVVANGKRVSEQDNSDGTRTWHYEALTPMPTYDFHVAAYDGWTTTESRSASGIPITTYAYGRSNAITSSVYADLPKVLDGYEASFGKYRWGTAGFLEEPIFGGGMEHATVVSMDETLFADAKSARKTAFHELGHHWSGNLVRIRTWNDFWLSEGFTEYLTAKAIGKVDGPAAEKETFRSYLADALQTDRFRGHALRPADPEVNVLSIFDGISYRKGACTLHMLERVVGEGTLTTFLRSWFDKHAFGAVTTADLEKELSETSGKDLSGFFRDFVYTAGHPNLEVTFAQVGDETELRVQQTQVSGPETGYRFPLDVELVDGAGTKKRVVVQLTGKTTMTKVNAGLVPVRVVADPDEVVVGTVTPR